MILTWNRKKRKSRYYSRQKYPLILKFRLDYFHREGKYTYFEQINSFARLNCHLKKKYLIGAENFRQFTRFNSTKRILTVGGLFFYDIRSPAEASFGLRALVAAYAIFCRIKLKTNIWHFGVAYD